MKKKIEVIETEWDKRKRIKERTAETIERKSKEKELAKQVSLHRFVKKTQVKLRKTQPKSEVWFFQFLKEAKISHYFQENVILNRYIPDFIDVTNRVIIEVDGSIHWNNEHQLNKDALKDSYYKSLGYTVFRLNHLDNKKALEIIDSIKSIYEGDSVRREKRAEKDHL